MSANNQESSNQPSTPQNQSSFPEFLADIWKHKQILWNSFSNYKIIALTVPTLLFFLKSRWIRKVIVKRHMVKQKNINLSKKTNLKLILRDDVFQQWDELFESSTSPQQIVLMEGYQGTGKSFLSQMYLERQSKIRPTLYISLRDITAENWKSELARQINFYAEPFVRSGGKIIKKS